MRATDEQYALLDAALESARIEQAEYASIRRRMKLNDLTESQVDSILVWLAIRDQWSDADLMAPDGVLEELREQEELDTLIRNGWINSMDNEALKGLWEDLNLAVKIVARFQKEYEREPTFAEIKIMGNLGAARGREASAKARGNGSNRGGRGGSYTPAPDAKCGRCGSTDVWDNRKKKASGEYKPGAPDFKCKSCQEATWLESAEPPKVAATAPVANSRPDDNDDGLPF